MKMIKKRIERNSRGARILFFFILTLVAALLMNLLVIPMILGASGEDKIPDMMLGGYTLADVMRIFRAIGPEGRMAFLRYQLPLDMLYPYFYGSFLALSMAWFFKKTGTGNKRIAWLSLLPLLAAFFDYLENIMDIIMLIRFPDLTAGMVSLAAIFTVIKGFLLLLSVIVLLLLILFYLARIVAGKK